MSDTDPPLNRLFDTLSNHQRRYTLYYLHNLGGTTATVDEIADQLVEWEREWTNHDAGTWDSHYEKVRTSLHHKHLPRLNNEGLIDYDARSEMIRNWETPALEHWIDDSEPELSHLKEIVPVLTN